MPGLTRTSVSDTHIVAAESSLASIDVHTHSDPSLFTDSAVCGLLATIVVNIGRPHQMTTRMYVSPADHLCYADSFPILNKNKTSEAN